jgi:hypothetical protein
MAYSPGLADNIPNIIQSKDAKYIVVDNTKLSAVAECSNKAVLRHVLHLTTLDDSAALEAGKAFHECLEVWFKGGTKVAALDRLVHVYQEWAEEHLTSTHRLWWENVYRILDVWLTQHPVASFPFIVPSPEFIEVGFVWPLVEYAGFTVLYVGRLDGLVRDGDDWWVLEHKSTGRIHKQWAEQFLLSSQIDAYLWGAQKHLGDKARVVGVKLNGVELPKLPGSDRACPKHGMKYIDCGPHHAKSVLRSFTRTQASIDTWERTAIHLAKRFVNLTLRFHKRERLHNVAMQGAFRSYSCSFCQYLDFCSMGRPLNSIDAMLRFDPWVPFDIEAALAKPKEALTVVPKEK